MKVSKLKIAILTVLILGSAPIYADSKKPDPAVQEQVLPQWLIDLLGIQTKP